MKRALLLLALTLSACGEEAPEHPEDYARVYDTGRIREAARSGEEVADAPAQSLVALRGQPIAWLAPPYTATTTQQRADEDGLVVTPAFSEGLPAAYLTTELWYDLGPVWVQPLYVAVTEWNPANPFSKKLAGSRSIFSVGVDSPFYSPYWQVKFVVVPAGTDPDSLTNVKSVLDPGYELHDGPLRICSIVPLDVGVAQPEGGAPSRPLNGDPVGNVRRGQAWVDGKLVGVLDFGADRLTADEHLVVPEDALFHFQGLDASGTPVDLPIPAVAGVGPYRSGASGLAPNNVPRFGALWRIYDVQLPPGAAIFVTPDHDTIRQQLLRQGAIAVPDLAPEIAADPRFRDYELRVALDARCFSGDAGFPDGCVWLDAQSKLESLLPEEAFTRTDVTATCPLLELNGKPVPN